jgi:predicted alpha/beta superfamily hydrolase
VYGKTAERFRCNSITARDICPSLILMKTLLHLAVRCVSCLSACVHAESAVLKPMEFSITADVGFGKEVCVLGAHPLLGGGDPRRAPKLAWTPGNVWRGTITLEAGATFGFQYVSRDFAPGAWGQVTNSTALGSAQTVVSPAHVAPPWGAKCVIYRSTFAQPRILYRDLTHGGNWTEQMLRDIGPGRVAGERTFRVDGLAPSGSELEFVFHNGAGVYDNAPAPPNNTPLGAAPAVPAPYQGMSPPYNYRTSLDVFVLQDGAVFNYWPAAAPSAPRFETRQVASTIAGVPGRPLTILLPRGYDQNPRKRYPVVYFHDGQNVFFPGGPFGVWDADRIARHETSQGRMREAILVSIPNGNDYGSNRLREYLPTGEMITYAGTTYSGNATAFMDFLLANVMPTLDVNYRTLTRAADTLTIGSSMGGLFSDHLAFTHPNRFGAAGIYSPAYWAAPNWVALRDAAAKLPIRRYLYMGTAESSTGESSSNTYWRGALQAHDAWMKAGNIMHAELRFEGGAGEAHNEAAWSRRLPAGFAFLLDPQREGQPLAQDLFAPQAKLAALDLNAGTAVLRYTGLLGNAQSVQQGDDLSGWSTHALPPETELWETRDVTLALPTPHPLRWFYRLKQETWPQP